MAGFDIGTHCSVSTCQNLDFLPFVCDECSLVFCGNHRTPCSHECESVIEKKPASLKKVSSIKYRCSIEDCNSVELVPILCSLCSAQVCLLHRLPEDHNCIKLTSSKKNSLKKYEQPKQFKLLQPKKLKNPKALKMAAKVALMKLKLHSNGDNGLPENERIYFSVHAYNVDSPSQPFFISKNWTVGKVIDYLANKLKIPNNNHIVDSPKLRLCSADSGYAIFSDMIVQIALDNELLFNGSAIVLATVKDNEITSSTQ